MGAASSLPGAHAEPPVHAGGGGKVPPDPDHRGAASHVRPFTDLQAGLDQELAAGGQCGHQPCRCCGPGYRGWGPGFSFNPTGVSRGARPPDRGRGTRCGELLPCLAGCRCEHARSTGTTSTRSQATRDSSHSSVRCPRPEP